MCLLRRQYQVQYIWLCISSVANPDPQWFPINLSDPDPSNPFFLKKVVIRTFVKSAWFIFVQELFFFIVLFKLSLKFYFNVFKFNTKNIVCKLPVGSGPELAHPWRRIQFFLFGSATFYNGSLPCANSHVFHWIISGGFSKPWPASAGSCWGRSARPAQVRPTTQTNNFIVLPE